MSVLELVRSRKLLLDDELPEIFRNRTVVRDPDTYRMENPEFPLLRHVPVLQGVTPA